MGIVEHEFRALGGASELFRSIGPEVLVEGPAGTGKSRACGEYIDKFCMDYPGVRVLIFRKTRVSLSESFLVTLEDKVWWRGHPCLLEGPTREHRSHYDYPNGSRIVLGGMDNPTRLFSTEYDLAYCNEATELTENEWESIHRALRNGKAPYQQLLGDCNPDTEFHWLNQRCNAERTKRILSRFEDNPSITEEYLERLSNLTGVRKQRLYYGRWVSAEGQIWEEWDQAKHLVDIGDLPEMKWYFGSVDWGFRAPGVFQVWGVTGDGDMYRVEEVYRTEQQIDWWADQINKLHKKYDLVRIACDPAEPRSIDMLNDRLGVMRMRETDRIAQKADNDISAGLDQVRAYMLDTKTGRPRLFLVRGALLGRDSRLVEANKPTCTEEEVPSYVWAEVREGRPVRERPDPGSADHGCDAMRYAVMYAWRKDHGRGAPTATYNPGTFGQLLGHKEVLEFEAI